MMGNPHQARCYNPTLFTAEQIMQNPLKSVTGTLISGLILAVILGALVQGFKVNIVSLVVWAHVFVGIIWIGLLYYFNFVQIPAVGAALADSDGPGPAAINKYVAPRALLWFRWAALLTWLTGAAALEVMGIGILPAFTLESMNIGIGVWLGTIMLVNVWAVIWPNQKKVLGMVEATDEEKASAKNIAMLASRTNTLLSIPMLMSMVSFGHGGLAF